MYKRKINTVTPTERFYSNLADNAGVNFTYGDTNHKHAVTQIGAVTFTYDANGNQTTRKVGNDTYTLIYDAENRLTQVKLKNVVVASFVYDGDGKRVMGTIKGKPNDTVTSFIGNIYEYETVGANVTTRMYYYAGVTRIAMRVNSTLSWLLGDHLGSQAITTDSNGVNPAEIRYYPWGTARYTSGMMPTTFHFTGQRLEVSLGLYYYGARWYDPAAGRFVQADTIVPGGVQGLDRYAYVNNNPLNFTDPSGHYIRLPIYPFDPCHLGICNEWINNNTPSIIPTTNDPVTLTAVDYQTGVSGSDIYQIYISLGYDLNAFLEIMIMKELGGWWANDVAFPLFKQALVTRFYDWASTNCSNATFNCMMNWWASYSQSAALAYNEIAYTEYGKEYWKNLYGYY